MLRQDYMGYNHDRFSQKDLNNQIYVWLIEIVFE